MPPGANWKEIVISKELTIPKLFLQSAKKYWDRKVAMREKEFGVWRPITWKEYYEKVKRLALGMVSLGLEKGDKVAMIGDNRPEALWAENHSRPLSARRALPGTMNYLRVLGVLRGQQEGGRSPSRDVRFADVKLEATCDLRASGVVPSR